MKKLLFIFISSFFIFHFGYAQKNVDIDNLKYQATYKVSPQKPQTPLFFYFNTKVNLESSQIKNNVNTESLEKELSIEGQRKTTDLDKAKMTLEISLYDFIISEVNVKEYSQENKDKSRKYWYKLSVVYNVPSEYKILEGEDVLKSKSYKEGVLGGAKKEYDHSSSFNSNRDANEYWKNNRESLSSKFIKGAASELARNASYDASFNYGFRTIVDKGNLKTTDEKKHPENLPFQEKTNALKKAFEAMTPEVGLDISKMTDIIEYYQSIPEKYTDPKLKADRKLRYASYYNLCLLYLYAENLDKAEEYAELIIANDYDPKDGEKLKKSITNFRENLGRTIVGRTHFDGNEFFEN